MQLTELAVPKAFPALQLQVSAQLWFHSRQVGKETVSTRVDWLVHCCQLQGLTVLAQ